MISVENPEVLTSLIDEIKGLEAKLKYTLPKVADEILKETKSRIKDNGQATNGSRLRTKSSEFLGAYSKQYGRRRGRAGLQTGHVDLTFTGEMMDDFSKTLETTNEVDLGFNGDGATIAGYMEAYYETPIFDIADELLRRKAQEFEDVFFES